MLEGSIYSALSGASTVTNITSTRIYPVVMPQETAAFPVLTYQRVGASRSYHLRGYADLDEASIQIDAWSTGYGSCKTLSTVVIRVMEEQTAFKARCDDVTDLYEDAAGLHRVSMDFSVWFRG